MITPTFRNFARHLYFLQTDEIDCYELTDESIDNSYVDIFQNIHADIEDDLLTPEIAFFHAYVFALQLNGRYEGYDTVEIKREIESLHNLHPDEKKEILETIDVALSFYNEAIIYDPNLQSEWKQKWDKLKDKLCNAKILYAENNVLMF